MRANVSVRDLAHDVDRLVDAKEVTDPLGERCGELERSIDRSIRDGFSAFVIYERLDLDRNERTKFGEMSGRFRAKLRFLDRAWEDPLSVHLRDRSRETASQFGVEACRRIPHPVD